MKYLKNVVTLKHDEIKCTGCGMCIDVCPHSVFVRSGNRIVLADRDACMECGACARNCSFNAIEVDAGVGCAAAILIGFFTGKEPTCG